MLQTTEGMIYIKKWVDDMELAHDIDTERVVELMNNYLLDSYQLYLTQDVLIQHFEDISMEIIVTDYHRTCEYFTVLYHEMEKYIEKKLYPPEKRNNFKYLDDSYGAGDDGFNPVSYNIHNLEADDWADWID